MKHFQYQTESLWILKEPIVFKYVEEFKTVSKLLRIRVMPTSRELSECQNVSASRLPFLFVHALSLFPLERPHVFQLICRFYQNSIVATRYLLVDTKFLLAAFCQGLSRLRSDLIMNNNFMAITEVGTTHRAFQETSGDSLSCCSKPMIGLSWLQHRRFFILLFGRQGISKGRI